MALLHVPDEAAKHKLTGLLRAYDEKLREAVAGFLLWPNVFMSFVLTGVLLERQQFRFTLTEEARQQVGLWTSTIQSTSQHMRRNSCTRGHIYNRKWCYLNPLRRESGRGETAIKPQYITEWACGVIAVKLTVLLYYTKYHPPKKNAPRANRALTVRVWRNWTVVLQWV